jgi:glycosyltransferase involved in cell wall biosynthesis
VRTHIGGVERLAREMALRLPAMCPDRYRVIAPPPRLAHRAGHLWEQGLLPALASGHPLLYSPANLAPVLYPRNAVVIHDAAALRHPEAYSPAYVAYQRRMLPALARRARVLITVSEFSRGELVEMLGVAPERITVIPEGVDERFFAATPDRVVAARYALPERYVLALGTVSERKNLDVLGRAAGALHERGIELVVAGSERGYLRGSAAGLRRLGYVGEADLPAVYAGAQALAMPSRYEGFGLPCLEAMAAGTPVVAAARAALPETVADAGLLIDPDDAAGFAQALVSVVDDPDMHARLVAAGRSRAARFSWSATALRTDETLMAALSGQRQI